MNVAAGPELAAAVTNAGGLGVIGGIGYIPKILKQQVRVMPILGPSLNIPDVHKELMAFILDPIDQEGSQEPHRTIRCRSSPPSSRWQRSQDQRKLYLTIPFRCDILNSLLTD